MCCTESNLLPPLYVATWALAATSDLIYKHDFLSSHSKPISHLISVSPNHVDTLQFFLLFCQVRFSISFNAVLMVCLGLGTKDIMHWLTWFCCSTRLENVLTSQRKTVFICPEQWFLVWWVSSCPSHHPLQPWRSWSRPCARRYDTYCRNVNTIRVKCSD